ncbi:MAG: ankyrin repeat domain-containing protein, partial [Infirmifilum uzonense]
VDVDAGTGSRPTPLRYAAGGGDPELVKMFWSADLDAQYNDGKKAAELARKKGHLEVRIP